MKTSMSRFAMLSIAAFTFVFTAAFAADPRKEDAAVVTKLVTAVEKADYGGFIGDEPTLKKLTKDQFATVGALYGARLKAGYTLTFFGELKQEGHRVSLWKIVFKDGRDDALVTLSMKDGAVGGFFIR